MSNTIYKTHPVKTIDDIPVFSLPDKYIQNYEKISSDHLNELERSGHNPFMNEEEWKEIEESTAALITKYSSRGSKILDVGVGLGRLLDRFNDLEKYGMDISMGYLNISKNKGINCCVSLIEDMPYKNNMFDIVTCTDVLEHVLDLHKAISNILDVLKPGGVLIVRVPYKEDISGYLSPDCPYDYVHVRSFDENELRSLFSKIFETEILEWNTTGTFLSYERLKQPLFPYNSLLNKLTKFYYRYKSRNKDVYKTFFNKTEINFVIRKINKEV